MRGRVEVQDEQSYENWLDEQETFATFASKQKKLEINETKLVKK